MTSGNPVAFGGKKLSWNYNRSIEMSAQCSTAVKENSVLELISEEWRSEQEARPQFPYFVQLCFSDTLKGLSKTKAEGRTTTMIKVISRILKSNALHPGKEQAKEEHKAVSSITKVERKWLLTLLTGKLERK